MSRLDRRHIIRARKVVIRAEYINSALGGLDPEESAIVTYNSGDTYTIEFESLQTFDKDTVPSIHDLLSFE